jgi:hypothetical protein
VIGDIAWWEKIGNTYRIFVGNHLLGRLRIWEDTFNMGLSNVQGWKVDITGSGLCPMPGFDINGAEDSGYFQSIK